MVCVAYKIFSLTYQIISLKNFVWTAKDSKEESIGSMITT